MSRYVIEELATGQWKLTEGDRILGVFPDAKTAGRHIERREAALAEMSYLWWGVASVEVRSEHHQQGEHPSIWWAGDPEVRPS